MGASTASSLAAMRFLYQRIHDWSKSDSPKAIAIMVLKIVAALYAITAFAVFLYGVFYYTYVPKVMNTRPLNFYRSQVVKVTRVYTLVRRAIAILFNFAII